MEPVGDIIPRVNFGLAPRKGNCWVCINVSAVEDVTVRLIDDHGADLPYKDAITYLKSIGHEADRNIWTGRLKSHRNHVRRSMAKPPVYSPAGMVTRLAPTAPQGGSPTWVRAPDRAVDLGMAAMDMLFDRLEMMEDADAIAVARLGITAAGKRGDWEAKGRQLGQMEALIDLAFEAGQLPDE